jgi:hypothetical protein
VDAHVLREAPGLVSCVDRFVDDVAGRQLDGVREASLACGLLDFCRRHVRAADDGFLAELVADRLVPVDTQV